MDLGVVAAVRQRCPDWQKGIFDMMSRLSPVRAMAVRSITLRVVRLASDRRAVTSLEYGILASLLGLELISIFGHLGSTVSTLFSKVDTSI